MGPTPTNEPASKRGKQQGKNLKKLSHSLSWALRHAAVDLNLTMTPDGYAPVDEILACPNPKFQGKWTLQDVETVVETSDKQRFSLCTKPPADYGITNGQDTVLCIRANQGHSVPIVDPEKLLTRLSAEELALMPVIVHGTYIDPYRTQIAQQGLKRMKRHHIHCAAGLPDADGVISGMRKSCTVNIYIDAVKCAADGIVFYKSDNGVILTAGVNNEGTLPPEYFSYVTDKEGTVLLDQRKTC